MNNLVARQVITIILTVIFGLNIIMGFVCGAGWNLGYNAAHHQHVEKPQTHSDHKVAGHHHENGLAAQERQDHNAGDSDCCKENVLKISLAGKSVPKPDEKKSLISFTFFTQAYPDQIAKHVVSHRCKSFPYLIPGHHPPIQDIRIGIQSFQI